MKISIEDLPNEEAMSVFAQAHLRQRTRRIVESSVANFRADVVISIMVQELKVMLDNLPNSTDDDFEEAF